MHKAYRILSNIQQIYYYYIIIISFQVVLVVKNPPANAEDIGDTGLIPGSGRSLGVGNGNPLQYSYLENPMDRGAWRTTVHEIAESDTTELLTLI